MAPQRADKLEVGLPGNTFASRREAERLAVWPSVRLRIIFDEYHLWWRSKGSRWHDEAVAAALELAALVDPSWIVQDTSQRWSEPVLTPSPYSKGLAAKYLTRTLFAGTPPSPWTVLRSGERLSVQYERSLLALHGSVQVFLPPTAESAARLERVLDSLAGRVTFAWAGVGFGLAGWASVLALASNAQGLGASTRVTLPEKQEQKQPAMDADWLVWLGERWRQTPAQAKVLAAIGRDLARRREPRGSSVRIGLPRVASLADARGARAAKRLRAELRAAAKKINAIAYRALLRRPVPGA